MRIHVTFTDRVGITQEVLALLGARNLNLDAVEMVPPNVYIDAPELRQEVLHELHGALLRVRGVLSVQIVDMLPGQRRSLHLDALLAAMGDPVLAVDAQARVLLANPRLIDLCGRQPAGESLSTLFDEPGLAERLMEKGFRLPMHEVSLGGQPLLLDATPIRGTGDALDGGLLTLYPPSRIGERLSLLHHDHAEGLQGLIGKGVDRYEGPLKVSGAAHYAFEDAPDGTLYAHIAGATIGAGKVLSVDASAAENMAGVVKVFVGHPDFPSSGGNSREEMPGWTDAIDHAAGAEGVTLAVVPLRVLAEADGVLDRLTARGFDVSGPEWR